MIYVLALLVVVFYLAGLIVFRALINSTGVSAEKYEYVFWPYIALSAFLQELKDEKFKW